MRLVLNVPVVPRYAVEVRNPWPIHALQCTCGGNTFPEPLHVLHGVFFSMSPMSAHVEHAKTSAASRQASTTVSVTTRSMSSPFSIALLFIFLDAALRA
jgi:hypothetical protein